MLPKRLLIDLVKSVNAETWSKPWSSTCHPLVNQHDRGMISLETIRQELGHCAPDLQRFKVAKLSLFGSAARGDPRVNDLDFLVEFSQPPGLQDFMGLKFFLEDLFQMPVDLHSQASCPERFYKRIQADLKHVA